MKLDFGTNVKTPYHVPGNVEKEETQHFLFRASYKVGTKQPVYVSSQIQPGEENDFKINLGSLDPDVPLVAGQMVIINEEAGQDLVYSGMPISDKMAGNKLQRAARYNSAMKDLLYRSPADLREIYSATEQLGFGSQMTKAIETLAGNERAIPIVLHAPLEAT